MPAFDNHGRDAFGPIIASAAHGDIDVGVIAARYERFVAGQHIARVIGLLGAGFSGPLHPSRSRVPSGSKRTLFPLNRAREAISACLLPCQTCRSYRHTYCGWTRTIRPTGSAIAKSFEHQCRIQGETGPSHHILPRRRYLRQSPARPVAAKARVGIVPSASHFSELGAMFSSPNPLAMSKMRVCSSESAKSMWSLPSTYCCVTELMSAILTGVFQGLWRVPSRRQVAVDVNRFGKPT